MANCLVANCGVTNWQCGALRSAARLTNLITMEKNKEKRKRKKQVMSVQKLLGELCKEVD